MLKTRVWIIAGCCIFTMATLAPAQTRKAGLWKVVTTTKLQKPGMRVGMFSDTDTGNPTNSATDGLPVCFTQAVIDTYGILLPPSLRDCELSNAVRKPNSITADMTCTGRSNGKGSIESTWSDDEHATGKIHFVGRMKEGPKSLEVGWTEEATAVFVSADCGSVKPRTIPHK